jgi:molybdopterin/thiamine biosynthesis adenylyltransferase
MKFSAWPTISYINAECVCGLLRQIAARAIVRIADLSGGGHIVQQCAHAGLLNYRLYDADGADESNLNRLVIATEADAAASTFKVRSSSSFFQEGLAL